MTVPSLTQMAQRHPVAILPAEAPSAATARKISQAFHEAGSENVLIVLLTDDKGLGPALGGAAPVYLGARLAAAGCAVSTAASDWQVGPDQPAMLAAVLEAERRAAGQARPEAAAEIARWAEERRAALAAGRLSLTIGHRDLLALPRGL